MRRLTTPLVALCLAGALAACGSDNTSDSTEASEATTSAAESATPSETASEAEESATPEAEETTSQETATPEDTGSGVAEAEMLPIPADGPPGITEFPVPAGSQLNDLGAFSGQWQFTILTSDPQSVIDFYAATLPELRVHARGGPHHDRGGQRRRVGPGVHGPRVRDSQRRPRARRGRRHRRRREVHRLTLPPNGRFDPAERPVRAYPTAVPSSSTCCPGMASLVTPSIVVVGATPATPSRSASTP